MPLELARTPESVRDAVNHNLRNPFVADDRRRDHIRIVTGPQPYRHSYYSAEQFFQTDPAAGVVTNVYGQRVLRVTTNFLRTLMSALADHSPQKAASVLYRIGREWGESSMREFAPRIEHEYEVEFEKMGMGMMLESWWWPMRASGWGTWRYDFQHARNGLVFLDLHESAVAPIVGQIGMVACYLYAGLFASAFTYLAHREIGCVELQCIAKGDPHCKFLVGTPRRVEAAAIQRDQGGSVEQIIQTISAMTMN